MAVGWRRGLRCRWNNGLCISENAYAVCAGQPGCNRDNLRIREAVIQGDCASGIRCRGMALTGGRHLYMPGYCTWYQVIPLDGQGKGHLTLCRSCGKDG